LKRLGEMALVREPAIARDLHQVLLARQQLGLGLFDLAVEQEMLGRDAEQLGEPPVEVERA
jgi:hypothetical protein